VRHRFAIEFPAHHENAIVAYAILKMPARQICCNREPCLQKSPLKIDFVGENGQTDMARILEAAHSLNQLRCYVFGMRFDPGVAADLKRIARAERMVVKREWSVVGMTREVARNEMGRVRTRSPRETERLKNGFAN
jgi:hypothetical protein